MSVPSSQRSVKQQFALLILVCLHGAFNIKVNFLYKDLRIEEGNGEYLGESV